MRLKQYWDKVTKGELKPKAKDIHDKYRSKTSMGELGQLVFEKDNIRYYAEWAGAKIRVTAIISHKTGARSKITKYTPKEYDKWIEKL